MTVLSRSQNLVRPPAASREYFLRQGLLKLLAIKDSDIRLLTLEQCRDAIDQSLHAGGAFSATIPLVALYYGGFMNLDVADPTRRGQDLFVLSKGHAVAALASIYAELGYFDRAVLRHSRSYHSILNGHPGPLLPGIHVATGPMGQGIGVAQGFAIAGRMEPRFDTYCLTGDGELQEGPVWEAVMYAGQQHLDNLCVMVDRNNGQLDLADRMVFPMPDVAAVFASFNWRVEEVDATTYDGIFAALESFKYGPRTGKPTAIICHATKGFGALSSFLNKHKVTVPDRVLAHEIDLQTARREARVEEFRGYVKTVAGQVDGALTSAELIRNAEAMHLETRVTASGSPSLKATVGPVVTTRAPRRDKRVAYDPSALPHLAVGKAYSAAEVVTDAMKVFALDERIVSVDADLATTSGLEAGVAAIDQRRALNVGVAEANMMGIGEAFAALGYNAWISTFCPFYDWKVLRRIAVGQQERLEAMAAPSGWLSDGHGLDLTMLATAADFETRTNGATHMGNDDCTIFDGLAHLKIINVSCPRQLLAIMEWIAAGERGLVYLRLMRTPAPVIYGHGYAFEFGKGHVLRESSHDSAVIVSSGRGVHEALRAADASAAHGIGVGVVDMPSIDEDLLLALAESGKVICVAEQNNGYIYRHLQRVLHGRPVAGVGAARILAVNTLDDRGRPQFIHSGTYEELIEAFGLAPAQLADTVRRRVSA